MALLCTGVVVPLEGRTFAQIATLLLQGEPRWGGAGIRLYLTPEEEAGLLAAHGPAFAQALGEAVLAAVRDRGLPVSPLRISYREGVFST